METLSRTRGDAPSVIAYDRRGFTQAAPDPAPSMRVNADDAAALLEHLDAVPAHILGWSAGGLVATCLAIEHPHTVRSLTPAEPLPAPPAQHHSLRRHRDRARPGRQAPPRPARRHGPHVRLDLRLPGLRREHEPSAAASHGKRSAASPRWPGDEFRAA